MVPRSQREANKRWRQKNRKKTRLYNDRAAAKRYVKKETNKRFLNQLIELIQQRLSEL